MQLDATWTPGTDDWTFGFRKDTGAAATDAQRKYGYEADNGMLLPDGTFARRFSW